LKLTSKAVLPVPSERMPASRQAGLVAPDSYRD